MKKIFVFLMLMFCFVNAYAAKINKLVFFGDSLSDNGNLYTLLLHVVPKSPPYFDGRFTNGTTWAENLGKYYYNKNYADYKIYAVGGATAVFHAPFSLITLAMEVDKYLADSVFSDKSSTLFVIWIGGNDYLFDTNPDVDAATSKVVNGISWAIDTLRYYGGKNFLVLNLPDLSIIPITQESDSKDLLRALTVTHNQKLDAAIENIQEAHPEVNITTMDIYGMFNEVLAHPEEYNKKYHTHVTNLTEACWTGGMTLTQSISAQGLTRQIQQAIAASPVKVSENPDAQTMSRFIMNTPALAYTYRLGQSYNEGNVPCKNPDDYLYWDAIHPSAVVHQILAQVIVEKLGKQMG